MNKTVTVNLGGIVFHIDENAYEALQKYLNAIRSHFTSVNGRDEIMQDIESRIAEMFLERIGSSKQVITLTDVNEVTAIMGKPEDFADEGESKSAASEEATAETAYKRRLFRNPDDKMLGGVCSGIAAYFDIDVVIIRIIWAILLFVFGSGFILYIILWIVMPEAKTTAEKLQMKGEPINVSNIEKNIKEEAEALKKKMEQWGKENSKHIGTGISRFFEAIGEILKAIFSFIGKLIVAVLTIFGIAICLVLLFVFLGDIGVIDMTSNMDYNNLFENHSQWFWAHIGLELLIGIPFLMLTIWGIRILFNIKARSRFFNIAALTLWFASMIICFVVWLNVLKNWNEDSSITQHIDLRLPASDTLYLKTTYASNDYNENKYKKRFWKGGNHIAEWAFDFKKVNFDITKDTGNGFSLIKQMTASGRTFDQAKARAEHINYSFTQKDSLLIFDSEFKLPSKEKFRNQELQLILTVPIGKYIYIDESMHDILHDVDNVKGIIDDDMTNRTWKMTEQGLVCVDCKGSERTKYGGWADKE